MSTWSKGELSKIAETDDLHISPFHEDGKTYGFRLLLWMARFICVRTTGGTPVGTRRRAKH